MNRNEFFATLSQSGRYRAEDLVKVQHAYWLSKKAHDEDTRDDGQRYFNHPRDVALLAASYGYEETAAICAALMHDAVEDTYTPIGVYINLFGMDIWKAVDVLSKKTPHHDPITGQVTGYIKKTAEAYFAALRLAPVWVRAIKCCDRLHNLRSMNQAWDVARKRKYLAETHADILPIADMTDPIIASAIREEVQRVEAELATQESIAQTA